MSRSNLYEEMKARHQAEISVFPIAFAFNQEQFDKGMEKLGLTPEDDEFQQASAALR